MRIIAGTLKGRRLQSPTWEGLRPTSDRLRETLFNVLAPRIVGARVLDGFAGTGALGIEALSRGARHVTFVDSDRRAEALIAANLAACGVETGYTMLRAALPRAFQTITKSAGFVPFDLILLDPPYDLPLAGSLHGVEALLAAGGCVVIEHAKRTAAPELDGLLPTRELRSGDSALAFYSCRP